MFVTQNFRQPVDLESRFLSLQQIIEVMILITN